MTHPRWIAEVRGYYADDVAPPKTPGALAVAVGVGNAHSRDMELAAMERRADIGRIVVAAQPR